MLCVFFVGIVSLEALWFVAGALLAYFLPRGSKVGAVRWGCMVGLTVWGHVSGSRRNAVFKTHVWPGRPCRRRLPCALSHFFLQRSREKIFTVSGLCSFIVVKVVTYASQLTIYALQLVKWRVNQGALLAYIHMSMSVQIKVYNSIR